jgi:hypothetical protein
MPLIAAYDYRTLAGLGAVNPNPPLVSAIAAAVRQQEGFYPGSAAYRYNNPGNLMDPDHRIWPQYQTAPSGEVIFPDLATGEAALENDLSIKISRGMTLTSLFAMYAPAAAGNNPALYAANVSAATGIDPNTPLNQVTYGAPASNDPSTWAEVAEPGGFDLAPYFEDPGVATPFATAAGVVPAGLSTGALVGLGIAGLALYLALAD